MIKVIYLLISIYPVVNGGLGYTHMYSEDKNLVLTHVKECAAETGISESVAKGSLTGDFQEGASYKKFLLCMNKKFGLQNSAGAVQKDVLRQKVEIVTTNPEWAGQTVERCAVDKADPVETAHELTLCYYYGTHAIA